MTTTLALEPDPGPEPAPSEPARVASWAGTTTARLSFDGDAAEYFRIWIIHTLLTILTLGIYSAWAKVRKARWFAQHTVLMGDRFDYHGEPWRVLVGRAMAVLLVVAWGHAFEWSQALGFAVLAVFCVLAPTLFGSAQRFRLANTSWRGIRFGFDPPRRRLYLVGVPLLLLWDSPRMVSVFGWEKWALWPALGLMFAGVPFAHAQLKRIQHGHARFGVLRFSFRPANLAYVGIYLLAIAVVAGVTMVGIGLGIAAERHGHAIGLGGSTQAIGAIVAGGLFVLGWCLAWPIFAALQQQIVWRRTTLGPLRFHTRIRSFAFLGLVLRQTLLVLLTAGLYWPFAAVALARYRIEAFSVQCDGPMPAEVLAQTADPARSALGDGSADAFGLDIGW